MITRPDRLVIALTFALAISSTALAQGARRHKPESDSKDRRNRRLRQHPPPCGISMATGTAPPNRRSLTKTR